MRNLDKYM